MLLTVSRFEVIMFEKDNAQHFLIDRILLMMSIMMKIWPVLPSERPFLSHFAMRSRAMILKPTYHDS